MPVARSRATRVDVTASTTRPRRRDWRAAAAARTAKRSSAESPAPGSRRSLPSAAGAARSTVSQPWRGVGVVGGHAVGAGAAVHLIGGAVAGAQLVVAVAAEQRVDPRAALEQVVARAAEHLVGAGAAADRIRARPALHAVGPVAAVDHVAPGPAAQHVVPAAAEDARRQRVAVA